MGLANGSSLDMDDVQISWAEWLIRLRALFVLLQNPVNSVSSGIGSQLLQKLARNLVVLDSHSKKVLAKWLSALPPDIFGAREVRPVQKYLSDMAKKKGRPRWREDLLEGVHLLYLLHSANAGTKIPASEFYNEDISSAVDLGFEYSIWMQKVLIPAKVNQVVMDMMCPGRM